MFPVFSISLLLELLMALTVDLFEYLSVLTSPLKNTFVIEY